MSKVIFFDNVEIFYNNKTLLALIEQMSPSEYGKNIINGSNAPALPVAIQVIKITLAECPS